MRKRIIGENDEAGGADAPRRLDLARIAQIELTSEDSAHPIDAALRGAPPGWRADLPGEQIIRMLFDEPQAIRRIGLAFDETKQARTQEFVLRYSDDGGRSYREIVRQQYNFSPSGTTRQEEGYNVELSGVTALELRIIPDIGGGPAVASLADLYVG